MLFSFKALCEQMHSSKHLWDANNNLPNRNHIAQYSWTKHMLETILLNIWTSFLGCYHWIWELNSVSVFEVCTTVASAHERPQPRGLPTTRCKGRGLCPKASQLRKDPKKSIAEDLRQQSPEQQGTLLYFSSCPPSNVTTTLNCPFRYLAAPVLHSTESCPYILYSRKPRPRVLSKACFPQTLHVAVVQRDTHANA